MRIVSNIDIRVETGVTKHTCTECFILSCTNLLELRYLRVKVREKCYVFFSFLWTTRLDRVSRIVSTRKKRKKKRRLEKVDDEMEISSIRIIAYNSFLLFVYRRSIGRRKIKKTPCARAKEMWTGKGSFARCWVRVRLIGGAVASVGETFAGLDRALLYSEVSWRAPCGSFDRSSLGLGRAEKKSRWLCSVRHMTCYIERRERNSFPLEVPGEMRCLTGYHRAR